jgi:pSer/pThr/pTyr-binding forkhead associated (FHA) protein
MSEEAQRIRIGRDPESDCVLSDRSVSRRHAKLLIDAAGGMEILDLESTGGTFLVRDGKAERIKHAKVKKSDVLRLGEYDVSVGDILASVEKSAPAERSVRRKAPAPPPLPKIGSTSPVGGRMVRCECGSIKKKGESCPACGS